jgi:hypothetical protein
MSQTDTDRSCVGNLKLVGLGVPPTEVIDVKECEKHLNLQLIWAEEKAAMRTIMGLILYQKAIPAKVLPVLHRGDWCIRIP